MINIDFSKLKYSLTLALITSFVSGHSQQDQVYESDYFDYKLEKVVDGIKIPWGMVWLEEDVMLISDRSGDLWVVENGIKNEKPVEGLPEIYVRGQGGLLDIELHPDYKTNGWIYISYGSTDGGLKEDGGSTAILRAKLKNNTLVNVEKLFQARPLVTKGAHFGGRMEFDNDGYLFFSVGDRGESENAQLLENHRGKVYRLNDDGSIPNDNPFINTDNVLPEIWSYGHRNPQGLALNPFTGDLWEHEHAPKGGDEINIIKKGANFGWPVITYGINYNGTKITDITSSPEMEQPVMYWLPSIAPCGMAFVSSDIYPEWKGDLMVGSLKFQYLERCVVRDDRVLHREKLVTDIGRLRNVRQGPDGYIYIAVEGDSGGIFKIIPIRE